MSNATEGDILGNASDIIKDLGVVDLAGGHLLVTEDSPKGMTVQVAGGIVYVSNSNYDELDSDTPKFYPVVCSSEVLTVDNNVSGSTRYDIVCVKVDKTMVPDPDADNIATKVVVKGTPGAGVPTTPANHYKLAEIAVVNGETEIEDSMITDTREQVTLQERTIEITEDTKTNIDGFLVGVGGYVNQFTIGDMLNFFYPVGTIYETTSTDLNTTTKMGNHFGGTWEAYGAGRVLVAKSVDTEFDTIGEEGGATTHTLTEAQMPPHTHSAAIDGGEGGAITAISGFNYNRQPLYYVLTNSKGSGAAHNNLQPYIVVYRYRRTA